MPSLATKMSWSPSSSISPADTPIARPSAVPTPASAVDVCEGAVAVVVIEDVLLSAVGQRSREGLGGEVVPVFGIEDQIAADVEIEQPVAVGVEEGRADAPQLAADPGLFGDIGEGAVAVVAVERVPVVVGDEEIAVAVVVVVGSHRRHAEARVADAGRVGDIGEGAVAVVAVEGVLQLAREVAAAHVAEVSR